MTPCIVPNYSHVSNCSSANCQLHAVEILLHLPSIYCSIPDRRAYFMSISGSYVSLQYLHISCIIQSQQNILQISMVAETFESVCVCVCVGGGGGGGGSSISCA